MIYIWQSFATFLLECLLTPPLFVCPLIFVLIHYLKTILLLSCFLFTCFSHFSPLLIPSSYFLISFSYHLFLFSSSSGTALPSFSLFFLYSFIISWVFSFLKSLSFPATSHLISLSLIHSFHF